MIDRSTKTLLAAIAVGLWANAALMAIRPATAQSDIVGRLQEINDYVYGIYNGRCRNSKIC